MEQPKDFTPFNGDWGTYFTYDGRTGLLSHKVRVPENPSRAAYISFWNRKYGGKVTGYPRRFNNGLPQNVEVGFRCRRYMAHRIIWEMHNGPIPEGMMIDHADGNPFNNRLENLRLATPRQNTVNSRKRSTNKSGYPGVSWSKSNGRWCASIRVHGKKKHLGLFDDPREAHKAYERASIAANGDFHRANAFLQ